MPRGTGFFHTTGEKSGLATRRYTVNSAILPEATQQELAALVAAALAEPRAKANPQLRDAMSYEIKITQPDGTETIVAYDGGLPPATSRLIKLMKSLAAKR